MGLMLLPWSFITGTANAQDPSLEVEIFGQSPLIDQLFDAETGTYFAPLISPDTVFLKLRRLLGRENEKMKAYVIDTGVLSHHPLIAKVLVQSKDFTGEGTEDENGHGTLVALIATGGGAPYFELVSVKAIGKSGKGKVDHLVSAIEWVTQEKKEENITVSMSVGIYLRCLSVRVYGDQVSNHPQSCERTRVCQAVSEAFRKGVLISAAVGNNSDRLACPACCRDLRAVGALSIIPPPGTDTVSSDTLTLVPVEKN